MADTSHALRYLRSDGAAVRALQFDGRVAGFFALLAAFPGRIAPHPKRDDALLVLMASGGQTRIEAEDWVTQSDDGEMRTVPDDQFRLGHILRASAT